MLDENLPAFFLKPAADGVKHHRDIFLSHHGSDPAPAYSMRYVDPASPSPAHKNAYGAALFDAYNPDVLFGEVLARPEWTQPTLNQDEIRRNGGIPPPPQPVLPHDFAIQLYNPEQQVKVDVKEGKWGASDSYEFSLPLVAFRTPSASNLDRGQSDPASLPITPKINFVWRKESKLSKDLTCYMTGKSTDTDVKKKSKRDPDIAIALWRNMRELTIYESNLDRLELEDPKGVEVVLLLSAIVIKDLYFASKDTLREAFNISDVPNERKLSGGGRKLSNANRTQNAVSIVGAPALSYHPPSMYGAPQTTAPRPMRATTQGNALPKLHTGAPVPPSNSAPPAITPQSRPPPHADPRSQWELDAETARLKAQADAEAKEERRRQKERAKADEAERKRLQRMVEDEERARRKKEADIEKETERLRRLYGVPAQQQQPQQQANIARPHTSTGYHRPGRSHPGGMPSIPQGSQRVNFGPPQQPLRPSGPGIYMQPSASGSMMMSGANPSASTLNVAGGQNAAKKKKSFFGLRGGSDEGGRLVKKGSAMW
jgi:hypothetical protein